MTPKIFYDILGFVATSWDEVQMLCQIAAEVLPQSQLEIQHSLKKLVCEEMFAQFEVKISPTAPFVSAQAFFENYLWPQFCQSKIDVFDEAAKHGDVPMLAFLKTKYASSFEKQLPLGREALQWAAEFGHLHVFQHWLRTGEFSFIGAPEATLFRELLSEALLHASGTGHVDIMKFLFEHCGLTKEDALAQRDPRISVDDSALSWAIENKHFNSLECLRDTYGITRKDLYDLEFDSEPLTYFKCQVFHLFPRKRKRCLKNL